MLRQGLLERLHDAARADAFVGNPPCAAVGVLLRHAVSRVWDARVMQCYDIPIIVEYWRSGRARLSISRIPNDVVFTLDELVVADTDLLSRSLGVLNNGEPLALRYLTSHLEQRQIPKLRQRHRIIA